MFEHRQQLVLARVLFRLCCEREVVIEFLFQPLPFSSQLIGKPRTLRVELITEPFPLGIKLSLQAPAGGELRDDRG